MNNYRDKLVEHLCSYRTGALGLAPDQKGIWKKNGRPYCHILPEEMQKLNVLETVRDDFWKYREAENIKLHMYFAHLNSSQAFAFNLFFPFLRAGETATSTLLQAMKLDAEPLKSWKFESVPDTQEATNFDVHLFWGSKRETVLEVKLTEPEFGNVEDSASQQTRLAQIYRSRLEGKVRPEALEEKTFFKNYQLLRNLAFANLTEGHQTVFLLPRENDKLRASAESVLEQYLLPEMLPYVKVRYVENVIGALKEAKPELSPLLARHVDLLAEKYLMS